MREPAILHHDIEGPFLRTAGLAGWSVQWNEPPSLPQGPWTWDDGLGSRSRRLAGEGERFLHWIDRFATVLVDVDARSIFVFNLHKERHLIELLLRDQIWPRILAHLGHLVLHAGSTLTPDGRAFLIVAPSLHGKSTLAAFLHREGWPVMGDDSAVLRLDGLNVAVRANYPRLRLRPDSRHCLYPDAGREPAPGWQTILDVSRDGAPEGVEHRLHGIFCLSAPDQLQDCGAERLSPSEVCIELLRNSCTLDPADREQAGLRMAQASAVANAVPGFRLSYPRDYACLPEVREVIRDALAAARG